MHGPHGHIIGVTRVFGHDFNTTGVLGVSEENGQPTERAFPDWITLPGPQWLALGRAWHFTAAWIFSIALTGYLLYSLISRRRRRLLAPTAGELRGLPATIASHARFRFHHARNYNILQKLTYLLVIFGLLPLMVLTGLTMSPTMDAAWPWLPVVFDGRQSARTIHFICAFSLVGFFFLHIALVLVSGLLNNLRSMITGAYHVKHDAQGNALDPHD
jgi:thiosulfate reductase cytochrome b subunit